MLDPEFSPGSEHTAHALMTNNTPKAWTYNAELYLVKAGTKYTSSGMITFSLAAGASRSIDFPIIMPDIEGAYEVYLDVYVAGEVIAAYQAIEDVVIAPALPAFSYSNERGDSVPKDNPNYHWLVFECDITNISPARATQIVTLWRQRSDGTIKALDYIGACNGSYGSCPICKDPGQLELTLEPGETYHYRFCNYNSSYLYVHQQYLWLEDDRGGESVHCHC